ncbi:sensor domain-containing protein [Ureibacillus manganicus]|uniref:sensor domain-containing protein n=1 Tax=Ureibacillus manganicus TaxID=1266064 RepID=UPI00068A98F1|nr:EAL domain-containing protein [Ureibacillus manganicus]
MDKQRDYKYIEQFYQKVKREPESIIVVNSFGTILFLNDTAKNTFFYTDGNFEVNSINILIPNYQKLNHNETKSPYIAIKKDFQFFAVDIKSYFITVDEEIYEVLHLNEVHEEIGINPQLNLYNKKLEAIIQSKDNYNNMAENLQIGIFKLRKNEDGNLYYTMSLGKMMDKIGANSSIIVNKSPFEVFPMEIAKLKNESYQKAFAGSRVNYEIELNGKLVNVTASPIKQGNEVTEIIGTVEDVTELRTAQREFKLNQVQYQSLINYSNEYITTLDKEGRIIAMNPKTMEMLDFTSDNLGKTTVIEATVEEERNVIQYYFDKALKGEIQFFEFEVKNKPYDKRYLSVTLLPIIIDNQIEGVYSIGKDITEEKKKQETNAYLAHHDELTRLPNRRWMEQKIKETLINAQTTSEQFAVLFIDLDRFKSINDTLGHYIGDQLLNRVAARIERKLEKGKHYTARMGGDEFMVLFTEIQSETEVIHYAQKLLDFISKPLFIEGHEIFTTASIGISIYPSGGNNEVELLKKADIALYKSKELGRNMYQIYETSMNKRQEQSFFMERDLRKAILNDEFIAYFQPRVDAITGKTISAEALIRWQHPEIGLVPPGEFIPLAEESGLIIPIGKWMKKRVCEQLVAWREANVPMIPISVNISSQRFLQHNFSSEIRELLNEYQLEGKWLEIEITENSIMRNEEIVLHTLSELKDMGVKVYIDDFGTGYSSFNYLKTFQLDGVKIDRSFIQNISSYSENAGITTAMIKVAQHLKLDVIAEGVETKEELEYLMEQNCTYIQGYFFGKPCPIVEFEEKFLLKI